MPEEVWRVGYTYQHPYDASMDQECEVEIKASSKEEALEKFAEDYSGHVDYCFKP